MESECLVQRFFNESPLERNEENISTTAVSSKSQESPPCNNSFCDVENWYVCFRVLRFVRMALLVVALFAVLWVYYYVPSVRDLVLLGLFVCCVLYGNFLSSILKNSLVMVFSILIFMNLFWNNQSYIDERITKVLRDKIGTYIGENYCPNVRSYNYTE